MPELEGEKTARVQIHLLSLREQPSKRIPLCILAYGGWIPKLGIGAIYHLQLLQIAEESPRSFNTPGLRSHRIRLSYLALKNPHRSSVLLDKSFDLLPRIHAVGFNFFAKRITTLIAENLLDPESPMPVQYDWYAEKAWSEFVTRHMAAMTEEMGKS